MLGLVAAEYFHVLAGFLLRGVRSQKASENGGMRRVDYPQFVECLRMGNSKGPGHKATPVVTHYNKPLCGGEKISQRANVLRQKHGPLVGGLRGLVRGIL